VSRDLAGPLCCVLMLCATRASTSPRERRFTSAEPMFLRTSQRRAALAKYFRSRTPLARRGFQSGLLAGYQTRLPVKRIAGL